MLRGWVRVMGPPYTGYGRYGSGSGLGLGLRVLAWLGPGPGGCWGRCPGWG